MTTPPIPPTPPDEPGNVWAAPSGSPAPQTPFPVPPAPSAAGVPPHRTSRVGLVIVGVLGVLLLTLVAGVGIWFAKSDGLSRLAGPGTTSNPPTSTSSPLPAAEVGDCVKMSGASFNIKYDEVSCEGQLHNYTVVKVLADRSEKCGDDPGSYMKYHGYAGRKSVNLCLIPVFADGQCYSFTTLSLNAEFQTAPCGGLQVVQVKVLANTVDKAACGASPALALAYPDIKTTYCFTDTYKYGR
ncbi:hypothetical protein SK571_28745 [Lentzea sp. BCCO 10_0798]|uniref:Serine/threonine protein kinase n=1 Tax=Lentzea kristufekii TaxID=3095430 RepID=A0ABU4TZT4_9PSEU|nr:hypothetical protein [Lentzea sp. BCCO 10_0798]MDX8053382.1 hypothetical protein [Lentzea sp. BCCO 10_0798]